MHSSSQTATQGEIKKNPSILPQVKKELTVIDLAIANDPNAEKNFDLLAASIPEKSFELFPAKEKAGLEKAAKKKKDKETIPTNTNMFCIHCLENGDRNDWINWETLLNVDSATDEEEIALRLETIEYALKWLPAHLESLSN